MTTSLRDAEEAIRSVKMPIYRNDGTIVGVEEIPPSLVGAVARKVAALIDQARAEGAEAMRKACQSAIVQGHPELAYIMKTETARYYGANATGLKSADFRQRRAFVSSRLP